MASIVRGCGTRKKGGIYAEVPLSPFGMPFEYFLFDPPVVVDARELGLTAIGVKLIKRPDEDVYDVYDIIGADSYPNVADFVEEGRRFGLSRRLAQSLDFSLLSEKSKLILLHSKAFIANPEQYWPDAHINCPKELIEHVPPTDPDAKEWPDGKPVPSCIGLWMEDIEGGEAVPDAPVYHREETADDHSARAKRMVVRKMPAFSYVGHSRPEGVTPEYKLAIFGAFPIGRLAVINDPDAGTHEGAMSKASRAKISVDLEDE